MTEKPLEVLHHDLTTFKNGDRRLWWMMRNRQGQVEERIIDILVLDEEHQQAIAGKKFPYVVREETSFDALVLDGYARAVVIDEEENRVALKWDDISPETGIIYRRAVVIENDELSRSVAIAGGNTEVLG